jgi:hypothetical protein
MRKPPAIIKLVMIIMMFIDIEECIDQKYPCINKCVMSALNGKTDLYQ